VDRGFVAKEFADADTFERREAGEVEILGMLRTSHTRNSFTPDNKPTEGTWYWADVDAMADYAGGEAKNVQPVFVEQIYGTHSSVHFVPVINISFQKAPLKTPHRA
jgi:surfeit locus 1 family protein